MSNGNGNGMYFKGTVNRDDFGQIYTIFYQYLPNDELNSRFHMGSSKYHVRATHIIHSTLADCYILKY